MGDGGVACAPSQHAMERFPNTEAFCSGGSTGFSPKPFQKMRRSERDDGTESKQELCSGKGRKSESRGKRGELEKGEFMQERHRRGDLEPGELQNGELEKGEFVPDHKWRRDELEKGEFVLDKWSKYDVETGEIIPDKWSRRREEERSESGSGKGRKSELEKGEFILDSWRKGGRERERSPGDFHRRKDGSRSEQDRHTRHSSKWDGSSHERDTKNCSRVTEDEPGQYKYEHSNGKSHGKKHSSGTWPKWPLMELDSSGRKHREEFNDHSGLKSRRISEESNWSNHLEKGTRNVSSSAPRLSLTGRYSSSRHHQPSLPSRGCHDRPGRSPGQPERSPLERTRHYDHRDRSPDHSEQSSHDRARHHDHKDRTSSQSERSSHDRARHHDHRDRTPGHLERSPHDRSRASDHREQKRRGGGNEKQQNNRKEERLGRGNSSGKDANRNSLMKPSNNSSSCPDSSADDTHMKEKELQNLSQEPSEPPPPPPHPPPPPPPLPPQTLASGTVEEPPSMEEDMDICDTPPHVAIQVDMDLGKWYYLDHFGVERGPSKLADLKMLVEEGILLSDHLIKHSDSDRWVTVENAASPLVSLNLSSIVSDTVTQMVSPPEAPGNLLGDADVSHEAAISLVQQESCLDDSSVTLDSTEDYDIDERVGALLDGYTVIHGKELESIGEALNAHFVHTDLEKWGHTEDFTRSRPRAYDFSTHVRDVEGGGMFDGSSKEVSEVRLGASFDKENVFFNVDSSDWFDGRWSCMGGDWKRNDESTQDRLYKRRQVLNDGYPLCLMPKSGYEDPRWQRKDDLYHTSRIRKLDLPPWAFSWTEDKNESFNDTSKHMLASRSAQVKPLVPRVVKGTMLPVIRINACVVKDQGSFEPRVRMRSSERHTSKSSRSYSTSGDRNLLSEVSFRSKKPCDRDFQSLHKCRTILNTPKDHVCTVDELSLNLGDWYYLDGAGHEHGPLTYVELQDLAANGSILKNSSVFRKDDNIWLPITSNIRAFVSVHDQDEKVVLSVDSSLADCHSVAHNETSSASQSFHNSHPQFIGYARGKLHELVMKSYKNREFAAAINEVLDPWMSSNQPKKEMDRHFPFNSSITKSSAVLAHDLSADKFWKSEDNSRSGKRARLFFDESNGDSEMEEDIVSGQGYDCSFDDLCGEAASVEDNVGNLQAENESWGLLNVCVLARVFHFLRKDMKSLLFSAATCKQWKTAVNFYKSITNYVDLSSAGPSCTDSMFRCIMDSYDKKNITYVVLAGCSNITASLLEEVLCLCPSISSVDISGCSQFRELKTKCQNVKWLKGFDSSCTKTRSLKQITEKSYLLSKAFRGSSSHLDDSDEHVDSDNHELDLNRKDSSSHPFRQGYYKGKRLHDARKSSAALSRTTHMKQLVLRNQYKKMEEFIAISLKEIMRENTFDFFIPKVAQIEGKMRSGYYVRSGLGSIKEDIRRMCRDALKVRNRGDAGELNQIMMSFIQLLKSLDENPKLSNDRDEMIRSLKDDSDSGFNSSTSKYGKKLSKPLNEKRGMTRGNSTSYANGGTDYGTFAFEREIRRRLSKLKRRNMDSESETSDDLSEDVKDEGGSTDSDTESDLDLHSGEGIGDVKETGYFMMDEALDSISADREWGARMTKASLAPPVTRKYEVIDRYLIIADEDEVQRKMQVALPDDYAEKLLVQRSGKEESDMELPEVKEYKPRKVLGEEVIEQEVYGIDPYTHNLLLDSMPEESEWPLVDKHKFIEEVLLRALNKQVQHFTGTGNTPMVYPVQPVIEKIQKTAEEDGDKRIVKMCMTILKAMQSRPVDNYVAYRKGLGVVCNKEEGFGEDDFVVEFLGEVYPVWKWFEKQDGIRSLQKNNQDPAPEFYNIYLERPKGDRDGYDLVVVDAMHKANYASRICHSCRPNCEAKVTAVDGHYQIGIYAVRPISYGEEITFDYNSVTESKEEYEASVCLCGSQVCRGSYLNLTGEGAFQKVLKDCHGLLDRHKLMLEACEANSVSQEDYIDLARAGLGTCLLSGLPDWLVAYSAHLVRFISFERTKLPDEILKHNLEEKRKFFSDICLEVEKSDAEVQAEGVYNARLQNMAVTLDKVRYVMRCVFGDAKRAPPPLQKLSPEAVLSVLWKGEGSLVEELLQCMAPHIEADLLNELKSKIRAHDPSDSDDLRREIKKSLLWLRDELRNLPCTFKCRHDAAADLIHLYAYTKCFYKVQEYKTVKSPPVYISPLDLGPKYADKMGSGFQEYCKMYGETYCLGQLIYWHCQAKADPDCTLARSSRGCLSLPDVSSFYARSQKLLREHVYSSRTLRFMLSRMEKQPQRPWPKDRIWVFKSSPKFFGSPMLDAVLNNCPLDKEMVHWLRSRPSMFHGA